MLSMYAASTEPAAPKAPWFNGCPMNMAFHLSIEICAALIFSEHLPLPRAVEIGYWFGPYSILMSALASNEASWNPPRMRGVLTLAAITLPYASCNGVALMVPG